jgi:hypothetical protein
MAHTGNQALIDAIVRLAEDIGRNAPDCAPQALQIIDLARELSFSPDRATIQDALDADDMVENGLSDAHTKAAASAVAKALKSD